MRIVGIDEGTLDLAVEEIFGVVHDVLVDGVIGGDEDREGLGGAPT